LETSRTGDLGQSAALAARVDVPAPPPDPPADSPVRPAAVLITDYQHRVMHIEGGALAAHGLDPRGWVGLTIQDVLPGDAVPVLMPRYEAAMAGESQSFRYRTRDGRRVYEVQLVPH
jgi:PAS domain-containing protein